MDVAFVITELEPGGAERCLVKLALGLKQRGHQVNVISLAPKPGSGRDQLVRELNEQDVHPYFLGASSYLDFFRAKRKLNLLLSKLSPEVVQSFLFHANILCGKISKRANYKLIAGLRVSEPRRIRQWMLRFNRNQFCKSICVSHDVAAYAKQRLAFSADKLSVVSNGIDLNIFSKIPVATANTLGLISIPPLLTFIGRLDMQKGVDLIANNAKTIMQGCPDHDIAIVGDGPSKRNLQRAITHAGLDERVHFYGYREDAASILKASELLLFPSRWEGMPNVVIEAMAARKTVVACPADGIRDLLSHDKRQIAEPHEWSRRVIDLALDPSACERIGEANYKVVAESYQLSQMISQYENLYRKTMETL